QIDNRVRAAVATIVGSLGDAREISPLLRLNVRREEDSRVYRSVITALGKLGERTVASKLLTWVESGEKKARPEADDGSIGDREITVAERLNILDALLRLYILERLEEKYYFKLFEQLLLFAQSEQTEKEIRQQALFMLPQCIRGDAERKQVEQLLTRLLHDPEVFDDAHRALWVMRRNWSVDPVEIPIVRS
ncbi:MAG TPA: hypothetical protein VJ761_05830, partial [Ktedonobacteraceae bacterium]|nr:hypothetical protein [Ktedonobacteraceae bacterium]